MVSGFESTNHAEHVQSCRMVCACYETLQTETEKHDLHFEMKLCLGACSVLLLSLTHSLPQEVASNTHGFVGADLAQLCTEAALTCIRDSAVRVSWNKCSKISQGIARKAHDLVQLS